MVVTMVVGYFPAYAKETTDTELEHYCIHHPSHTPECGYTAPTEGSPCTHQHDEACGYEEGVEDSCTHQHDETCGYAAPSEGTPCSYQVNGCPYCVSSWSWADARQLLNDSDGSWQLSLQEVSQDNRMTRDTLTELLPKQITAVTDDGEEKKLDVTWDLSAIPEEGAYEGTYQVTASLTDDNYAFTDDVLSPAVNVQLDGKETYAAAENSCIHHPYHTPECGYTDEAEGNSCSYEMNGCPYCVVSWEWVDDQGILSESDGAWGIGLAGASESAPVTRDTLENMLPGQIVATTDDGGEKTLDIAWDLSSIPEEGASQGNYQVSASLVDESYAFVDAAAPLAVTVQAGGAESYAHADLPSGTPPYQNHIVDGVSPNGTTINLFDYWITNQNDSDSSDPVDILNRGINKDHALLFFINGRGNWNAWTGAGGAPYKGIVKDELVNGYPALNDLKTAGTQVAGRDGNESLAYLFDPSMAQDGKASYKDVQGLLQVDDDGYYYYDSQKNFATYYSDTNSFTLYEYPGVVPGGTSPVGQFFPFNEANADAQSVSHKGNDYTIMNNLGSKNTAINHYFGVHMSTRFIQQFGGHTDSDKTKAVTYEFSGDDDAWIFIDGKLVGDLGGVHDAASVKIDFSTGEVTITSAIGQTGAKVETLYLKDLLGLSGNTLADNTYHTLDFFYLERGNVDSNMYLKYNLVTIPTSGLIKIDQLGNAVQGAEFTLYGAQDYEYRGESATPVATGSTDTNGEFVFLTSDGAGGQRPITVDELYVSYGQSEDGEGNNLILVETKTPRGYRSCGEIGLYFDDQSSTDNEILLLASKDTIWGQGAYAMPKVTVTTANSIELLDDPNDLTGTGGGRTESLVGNGSIADPLMFAVVFQKQEDGTWHPVSGDPLSGWKVWDGSDWNSILGAAKASPHIFQLGSSGAYQVDIDDLPGNILNYYHILKDENAAQYTIGYYYTSAASLSQANEGNTKRINSESTDSSTKLSRVFSVNLYITDMKNRLLVQKVDEDGNTVNGAQFSLYKADEVTVTTDNGTTTVTPKEGAQPAVATTSDITMPLSLNGTAVFPESAGSNGVLENGEYWLVETSAPVGYKLKTEPVHVVVNDTGVYADAGKQDDGVTVLRGVGSVARSMIQFVVNDHVDITLRDIKAALAQNVTYDSSSSKFTWGEADWNNTDGVRHLTYTDANGMLDYGPQDSTTTPTLDNLTLSTDVGWSKLLIRQDYNQGSADDAKLKTDLGDRDITNLFSGTVTVRVANDKTGNLKISKQVTGNGVPAGQGFTFEVTVKDGNTPISGTYQTLDGNGTRSSIEFNNGHATVTLKGGESLTILALPTGALFTVQETTVPDGYTPSVTVMGDTNAQVNKSEHSATGFIQHDITEDAAVETAFTNDFDGSTSVQLKGKKTLRGRNLTEQDTFTFSLEAADDATKQAIESGSIVMPSTTSASVKGDGSSSEGEFTFDSIQFKSEGTYTFNIAEQLPSGASQDNPVDGDIWYDTHTTIVTVTVTRDATTGLLSAIPTYDNTGNPDGSTESAEAVFVNRWAGLKIIKQVTGDMGDRDKLFTFTITLQDKEGSPLTGTYPYTIGSTTGTLSLDNTGTTGFQLKHDQTITIYGLPAGSKYTISEPDAQADGYTTYVTVGNDKKKVFQTTGNLSDADTVEVIFENSRGNVPATGLRVEQLPWILAVVVIIIAGTFFTVRGYKKRKRILK